MKRLFLIVAIILMALFLSTPAMGYVAVKYIPETPVYVFVAGPAPLEYGHVEQLGGPVGILYDITTPFGNFFDVPDSEFPISGLYQVGHYSIMSDDPTDGYVNEYASGEHVLGYEAWVTIVPVIDKFEWLPA